MRWKNRENAACCGAGIRSVFRDLSLSLALKALELAKTDTIVSSFCIFNLRWAARKKGLDRKIKYISEIILEALR